VNAPSAHPAPATSPGHLPASSADRRAPTGNRAPPGAAGSEQWDLSVGPFPTAFRVGAPNPQPGPRSRGTDPRFLVVVVVGCAALTRWAQEARGEKNKRGQPIRATAPNSTTPPPLIMSELKDPQLSFLALPLRLQAVAA